MKKTLFLIRGLPGSGKSTLAYELTDCVYEADAYFMSAEGYKYNPALISNAHQYCQNAVMLAMERKETRIAVANTFTRRWEMDFYYALAHKYGYNITEITMSGKLYPNVHNVPEETINTMRERWEK